MTHSQHDTASTNRGVPDQSSTDRSSTDRSSTDQSSTDEAVRDIADVAAIEVINTVAVHLLSAAAVKCGLADDPDSQLDLDEARKLINALAGLITSSAPDLGDQHARALRDGLRSVQLAFREASPIPDPPGKGAGEKWTGPVN